MRISLRLLQFLGHLLGPLLVTLSMFSTGPAQAASRVSCELAALPLARPAIEKVEIPQKRFDRLLDTLRSTLSGKLATIWRSEWKTKLSIVDSNHYMFDLLRRFETPETQIALLGDLSFRDEGFVRKIHQRLFEMQEKNLLRADDQLLVRDPPPPEGINDRTFTYYTKPIIGNKNGGKHQVRVRTYVREIVFDQLKVGEPISAYKADGEKITLTRQPDDFYQLQTSGKDIIKMLTLAELTAKYGAPAYFFAPHGKSFKLEIKTALEDEIEGDKYPLLAGPHMVEKLDVGLSMKQVAELFVPGRTLEQSLMAIATLKHELETANPTQKARIDAVFDVLSLGLQQNGEFLTLEGATIYNRTAFESRSEFQTTFDRDQSVTVGTMYSSSGLRPPAQVLRKNRLAVLGQGDARHVELKIPVTGVRAILGLQLKGSVPELTPTTEEQNESLREAVATYYPYVSNDAHAGKFNYTRKHLQQLRDSLEP